MLRFGDLGKRAPPPKRVFALMGRIYKATAFSSFPFLLILFFPPSARANDWKPLLDKLTEKGVLSSEEREQIEKESEISKSNFALPFKLKVGGRIQFRFAAQQNDPDGKEPEDSFRIRRARLSAEGALIEDVDFFLEADVSREAALEQAEVRLKYFPEANMTLGQFKTPFSLENLTSAKRLDMVERTQAVTALSPDKEIGVMAAGTFLNQRLKYGAAVVNGNGKNKKVNDNDQFLYVLRIEGIPMERFYVGNQEISVSAGFNGATGEDSAARSDEIFNVKKARGSTSSGVRNLAGADLSARLGRGSIKMEHLWGVFEPDAAKMRRIRASGWYVQGGYYLVSRLQALVRHETFDPDQDVVNNADVKWTTVGLNYFIRGYDLRVQANYIFKREEGAAINDDTFLAMIQLLF